MGSMKSISNLRNGLANYELYRKLCWVSMRGIITFCALVSLFELTALNTFYGAPPARADTTESIS